MQYAGLSEKTITTRPRKTITKIFARGYFHAHLKMHELKALNAVSYRVHFPLCPPSSHAPRGRRLVSGCTPKGMRLAVWTFAILNGMAG